MSEMVNCNVCGRVYNQRYLTAHKRLSHGRTMTLFSQARTEPETLEVIVSIYAQLPEKVRKELRERLEHTERAIS
jgi:hypothetical protein